MLTAISGTNIVASALNDAKADRRSLDEMATICRRMVIEDILPLWSIVGADHVRGGYAETLSPGGRGMAGPRRVRVTARQVYAFCEAAELGWNRTAASALARHGYRFLVAHTCAEGFLFHSLADDDTILDPGFDLYDQAFLLLAYAHAYRLLGDDDIATRARRLQGSVRERFGHREGGFNDRLDRPYPLRANPHMHLLEAALAWIVADPDPMWTALADSVVALFEERLFDPAAGAVLETFDPQWRPIREDGLCRVEPGHNYEWAWLLLRWEKLTRGKAGDPPFRMIAFAENHGYDPARHVAVNDVRSDGSPGDGNARLWPQTERLKAWLSIAERTFGRESWLAEQLAADAAATLMRYLEVQPGGLWYDTMLQDGRFALGDAPASSLYHIIGAVGELTRYTRGRA